MATDAAAEVAGAARVFAEVLGIAGEAFSEAINAPDFQVEMEMPENLPVPKAMKKAWQNWCKRGHPDKGGDHNDFMAMKMRYENFKVWFQAHRNEPTIRQSRKVEEKVQAKKFVEKGLEEGRKALEGRQYEDAKGFAEDAINAYETYKKLLTSKDEKTEKKVAEAKTLLKEAEEHIQLLELEKKQREEYEEMHRGLNDLFHTVCSAVGVVDEGLAIPQKFVKLRQSFDACKSRITALESKGIQASSVVSSEEGLEDSRDMGTVHFGNNFVGVMTKQCHSESYSRSASSVVRSGEELEDIKGMGTVHFGKNFVGVMTKQCYSVLKWECFGTANELKYNRDGKFVAKCCFVGLRIAADMTADMAALNNLDEKQRQMLKSLRRPPHGSILLLLEHNATIGDLKREFLQRFALQSHKQEVSEDIDPLQLVCQDVNGEWLQDTDELPEASPTACADVGYHALFLFNFKAPSMRKGHVKERITEVSDLIIDNFISPPPNPGMILSTSDSVRSELVKRLTTRTVPARIPTTEILKVENEFRAIKNDDRGSTCQMPQKIIEYVESVIKGFTDLDFDALDPDFAKSIATRLRAIEPFVSKLAQMQTTSEWINYQCLAESSARWSTEVLPLSRLAALTKTERKQSVIIHEQIALADPDRKVTAEFKETIQMECKELAEIFEDLREYFNQAMTKKEVMLQQLFKCKEEYTNSSHSSKVDASKYEKDLQDERFNLLKLENLRMEYEELHQMVEEQIKWCKNFVKASSDGTRSRIETLDHEIKRLQELREEELARQKKLKECDEDLDKVLKAERLKADQSMVQLTKSEKDAAERVKRAEKAKSSAERFHKKVNELHLEVQEEIKGAVDYFQELLKVLAVDCHAAYLGVGKFLKFEALQKEKIYQTEKEAMKQASDAAEEAESEEQSAYQGTVDRANRARSDLAKATTNVKQVEDEMKLINKQRETLKEKFVSIRTFASENKKTNSSSAGGQELMIETLPMTVELEAVKSVEGFRKLEKPSSQIVIRVTHELESLEQFETDWTPRRYDEVKKSNVAKRKAAAQQLLEN